MMSVNSLVCYADTMLQKGQQVWSEFYYSALVIEVDFPLVAISDEKLKETQEVLVGGGYRRTL